MNKGGFVPGIQSDMIPILSFEHGFVTCNLSLLKIINEKFTQVDKNIEDTPIIIKESEGFGVSIYVDPSGIIEN